jgi:hypothetical protein
MATTDILIGSATVQLNGADIGYTRGGVMWRIDSEHVDIDADQAVGIVRVARAMERAYVEFSMIELTLENMRIAMMLPTANLVGSVLTLGYNSPCWVDEIEVILTGPGPSCGDRVATFPRCVAKGQREYSMKRDAAAEFKVTFEALKDTDGNFGTIEDI